MNGIAALFLAWAIALPGLAFGVELEPLIENCDGCHGSQGDSSDSDIPTIAGQTAEYIARNLHSYQIWGRPCYKSTFRHGDISRAVTTMCEVSSGLANDDIEALAAYYAGQKFVAAKQAFDESKAAAGAPLHERQCASCHPRGGSISARGPILAGQWLPYLKKAARRMTSKEHRMPPLLEKPLADFSDEEIDALMNYYASQQ